MAVRFSFLFFFFFFFFFVYFFCHNPKDVKSGGWGEGVRFGVCVVGAALCRQNTYESGEK